MNGPELSSEARTRGQLRGVQARQYRAQVRRDLRAGGVTIDQVLAQGQQDDESGRILARMKVLDLLCSFPGIGPVRAAEMMERISIATNRRIGGLGGRQIAELTALIDQRYGDTRGSS